MSKLTSISNTTINVNPQTISIDDGNVPIRQRTQRVRKISTYAPPPPIIDNNPLMHAGSVAGLDSGGKTLSFVFGGNYTLTVPNTGTVLLGSAATASIPQMADANTVESSNLKMTGASVLTLAADAIATVTAPRTGKMAVDTISALTPSANISMDCALGNRFTLTPDQSCAITPSNGYAGQVIRLEVVTAGVSSYTLTFSAPFKSTGTLATGASSGKKFIVVFYFDGTDYLEERRTAAL